MARITVEDCIDKFESRFELVLVASDRARKLHSGETPTVEKDNDKNTVIALREIAEETVSISDLKDKLVEGYQSVSFNDEEELLLDQLDSDTESNIDEKNSKDKPLPNEHEDKAQSIFPESVDDISSIDPEITLDDNEINLEEN